jgi:ribose transport system substrate-binding protein
MQRRTTRRTSRGAGLRAVRLQLLILLLVLTVVAAACGGDGGGDAAGGDTATTPPAGGDAGGGEDAGSDAGGGGGATTGPDGEVLLDDEYSVMLREAREITVDTSEFATEPPYRIATIVQGPTNGWGTIFDAVMNHTLEESGLIEDQLYVPWDFTTESQANGIDDAISRDVDAILLTSLSRAGLAASVERATAAGIPVITCMAGVETDAYTVEVSRNMPQMGYVGAKWLAEQLGGEGKIVAMHGIAGVDAAEFWKSGAEAAFAEYPGIEIVAEEYANWSVADATTAMRAILQSQQEIDGLWFGGMEMGLGAVMAFEQAGREIPPIGGTGPTNGFLRFAEEHDLEFFLAPFPPSASQLCVETMFRVLEGEPVQKHIDVVDDMEGTAPFGSGDPEARYLEQFNDEFIGPVAVDESVYLEAGFGR